MNLPSSLSALIYGSKNRAQGVDLAHYEITFNPIKATQRIDFAIMKLTEGTTWIDPSIETIWSGVQDVWIRGGYHYLRSGYSWLAQANHFISVAQRYDFHILVVDVEGYYNTLNDTFFSDARRMIDYVRKQMPNKKVMLYTNPSHYSQMYKAITKLYPDGREWMASVPLWIAQYWTMWSVDREPAMPAERKDWQIWQITDKGPAAQWGTGSNTDVNVFNGTPEQMYSWLNVAPPTDTEEPPVVVDPPVPTSEPQTEPGFWQASVVASSRVIVRSYPERRVETQLAGVYVYPGDRFTGNIWAGNGYVWLKIEFSTRAELLGRWVAVRELNGDNVLLKLQRVVVSNMPQLYRVKHDIERPGGIRLAAQMQGEPEVYRLNPLHSVKLTKEIQWMWYRMNPHMTPEKWGLLMDDGLAFCNKGAGMPNHTDYVNGINLETDSPTLFDQARICGGAVVTGVEVAGQLWIEAIDVRKPLPSVSEIMSKPWLWFWATTVRPNGTIGKFPQGGTVGVRVPLLIAQDSFISLTDLIKLPINAEMPSPYEVP